MPGSLVDDLENLKGAFGADAEPRVARLLIWATTLRLTDPLELIRLHETLQFLRAYPPSPRVLGLAVRLLHSFGRRLTGVPREEFEYAEVSGLARTSVSTAFSHTFASSLARRHGRNIDIDWDRYQHPNRLGRTLAKLIPEAFEDWAIQPHANWRRWYEKKRREKQGQGLLWLLEQIDPEVYALLELPLRWNLGDSDASRTRLRIPRTRIFYHDAPLLTRRDVSIAAELSKPKIAIRKLSLQKGKTILDVITDASAVRYRELYGFEYPDAHNVFHADLGRGVDFYFCGLAPAWKLPRRDYMSGMFFKNGIPTGYVEVMWYQERMEVGFNLYYTFRQGETAWLYARLLKLFHEQFAATSLVVDPYQLGHENDEAISSGAFWFYYKMGFRPTSKDAARLAAQEHSQIERQPGYRTGPRRLMQLAKSNLVYSIKNKDKGK